MKILLAIAVGVGLILILASIRKMARAATGRPTGNNPEARNIVSFDAETISVRYGNGQALSVRWADLCMVGIRTTDEGPFVADVFWVLHVSGSDAALVFPQGATGDKELLAALQDRLPGFDNLKLIEAMGCVQNAFFLIWERKDELAKEAA